MAVMISEGTAIERLSAGELDVLRLAARGLSNLAIAHELFVAPKTVEARFGTIYVKLDLTDCVSLNRRVSAVIQYLERLPIDAH